MNANSCCNKMFAIFLLASFLQVVHSETFYYFAYGSNLLAKRIHINNPTAVFYKPAKLEDYRLDFGMYAENWLGAGATIVYEPGKVVWGALWTLDVKDIPHLDKQESVDLNWYYAKNVNVTTIDDQQVEARTYLHTNVPAKIADNEDLPRDRRPSNSYLQVIALGAIESGIPADYVGYLFSFPTNGNLAKPAIRAQLGYPF